jgi:hypothetical protein
MTPTLTATQQVLDQTIKDRISQWNSLEPAMRGGPTGQNMLDDIVRMVERRNGAPAAQAVRAMAEHSPNGKLNPDTIGIIDSQYRDRIDGDLQPVPQPPVEHKAPHFPKFASLKGTDSPSYDAEPGDGRKWLPGDAKLPRLDDGDRAALNSTDADIERINQRLFRVDPNLAWKPSGAELPRTGTNISTLGGAYGLADAAMPKLKAAVEKLDRAFGAGGGSGEQLIDDQYERMRSAINTLTSAVKESQDVPGIIGGSGSAANDQFHEVLRDSDLAARTEIGEGIARTMSRAMPHYLHDHPDGFPHNTPSLLKRVRSNGEFLDVPGTVKSTSASNALSDETRKLNRLAARIVAPQKVDKQPVGDLTGGDEKSRKGGSGSGGNGGGGVPGKSKSGPGGSPGGSPSSSSSGSSPGKSGSGNPDLAKLLGQLGQVPQQAGPQAGQIPQQVGQAAQQAARPLADAMNDSQKVPDSLLKALKGEKDGKPKTDAQRASGLAGADRDAATSSTFTPPGKATADKLGKPGSDARPRQLDADGKPVDKDGDGKVDRDAKPLSKKAVKPFDMSVKSRDQLHNVHGVPDPRIGEMMANMADGTEDKPVAVLGAAKAAGMNLESLGDPADPADAKVGQAVIGDEKSGMYIGDGKVLTSTGEVEDLGDVTGEDGFVADIPLPELPDDVPSDSPAAEARPAAERGEAQPAAPPPSAPPPADAPSPDGAPPADVPPPVDAPPLADVPPPAAASPAADAAGPQPRQVPYEGHAIG